MIYLVATIIDVARHAGLSTATVSHVINNTRKVSPQTRERVLEAIRALDYRQNLSAKQLKTGTKYTVGFVVPDITNLFYATIIERVETLCAQSGFSLLLVTTSENPEREIRQLHTLASQQVGGLILASTIERYDELCGDLPDVPILYFDRRVQGAPGPYLGMSTYQAYYDAIRDIIRRGHRRLGYLAGLNRLSTTQERLNATRTAIADSGLDPDCCEVCYCNSVMEETIRSTRYLLESGCTAIVASNRSMMMSAICCLCGMNITIGQDVELIGTTECSLALPFADRINRISQPVDALSNVLGRSIISMISGDVASPEIPLLKARYIPRLGAEKTV